MGKVGKGVKCSVTGCSGAAVRSISPDDISKAGLKLTTSGRGYLCKIHYKELKKRLRKDRMIEKWRRMP